MARVTTEVQINLARYMERLDSYIEGQTELNRNLCNRLEALDEKLDDVQLWRTKIYGAKAALTATTILLVHTVAVMSGFLALMKWAD